MQFFCHLLLVVVLILVFQGHCTQQQDLFEQQSIAASIQALQRNEAQPHYGIMIQKPLHDLQKRARQQQQVREQIGVGIYILNLGEEDLNLGTFYADFLLYFFKNPNANFSSPTCTNLTRASANNARYIPNLSNAGFRPFVVNRTFSYRVMGKFYFAVDMKNWPFDTQTYDLNIEMEDIPLEMAEFCFMPDYTGLSPNFRFAGRKISDFEITYSLDKRTTPPYLTTETNGTLVTYRSFSKFSLQLKATRPYLKSLIKTILPPSFIILVVLYTYLLPFSESTTRVSVLGGMLVAAVMFHVGINNGLPHSSILSLADVFMVCVYVIVLCAYLISMLLLRLKKVNKIEMAKTIASYSELPGIVGTPIILLLLAFELNFMWIGLVVFVGSVLVLLGIGFLYNYCVRKQVERFLGRAIQHTKVVVVENTDADKWEEFAKK